MPQPSDEDESRRLAEWLRLEGLPPDFELGVHPRDEMLLGVVTPSTVRPGRELLTYLRNGQETAAVLEHALAAFGRGLGAPARVLELASGYGRVTRHLIRRVGADRLTACEIVPDAVVHVARSFGLECFVSRSDPSQISWPRRFDVIFVASLFSHLPRHRFQSWLRHLRPALADDGLLVLSTHGLWMPQAPPHDGQGFAFHPASESLTLSGAEYGTTFVAPEEVARLAREAGYAGVRWLERELWKLQDVFVLSPAPLVEAHAWRPTPLLDGAIDSCEFGGGARGGAPNEILLHGWVECRDPDQAIERATLQLGDTPGGAVTLQSAHSERRPPPQPENRFVAEWQQHAAIPPDIGGRRTLALVAQTATGRHAVDVRTLDFDLRRLVDGEPATLPPAT